jgi:hypothetical protein
VSWVFFQTASGVLSATRTPTAPAVTDAATYRSPTLTGVVELSLSWSLNGNFQFTFPSVDTDVRFAPVRTTISLSNRTGAA